jgi:3-phenylpropionate/trans-cinnamate dioxygenase ferredoxin subunit
MSDVKITALKDGPYKVEGAITLMYGDAPVPTSGSAVFLCRCGASSKKPFCDGTHTKIGFQAAAQAVPESREPGTP